MDVRPSTIAGTWYPDSPAILTRDIERYLAQVPEQTLPGSVCAIIVPHAGYRYSAAVAAYAFRQLQGLHPDIVAVIGPMHQPARAPLLTSAHSAYETPLGLVEIDTQAIQQLNQALSDRLGYGLTSIRNDSEHALEIELPFLQHLLGRFHLLPVMIRERRISVSESLGHALAAVLHGRSALLVASSDLSHYSPQAQAQTLDREILQRIAAFDPAGVLSAEDEGVGFACGNAAIAATLWAARHLGADQVTVLHHATSGDITHTTDSVVGYGAAVIWQKL